MAITALFGAAKIGMGMKSFISGGAKMGSSVLGAVKNTAVGVNKAAQSIVPQKKEEKENKFIGNYTSFFGSKKTEKILRKNLKLLRDSLVSTFEIAKYLKAAIVDISKGLKGGGKGGLFGGLGGMFGMLGGIVGIFSGIISLLTNPWIALLVGGGIVALLNNEDFMNFLRPIISFLVRSELNPFRLSKGKLDDPLKMTSKMRENIGDERTLAVLKGRLEEMEKNKPGWFSGEKSYGRIVGALKEEIKALENQGITPGEMSGAEYEKDLAMFTKEQEMRTKLQDLRDSERGNIIMKVRRQGKKEIGKALGIPAKEVTEKQRNKVRDSLLDQMDKRYDAILQYWYDHGQLPNGVSLEKGFKALKTDITGIGDKLGADWKEIIRNEAPGILNDGNKPEVTPKDNLKNNVNGVKSEIANMNFDNLFDPSSQVESDFTITEPFTFDFSQGENFSGGDMTNTFGGSSPSGNAVTFFPSSNPNSSYHKLYSTIEFNIFD